MVSDAAKCREPVRRRHLRKIAQKARHEFEAGKAVLPGGKLINGPVVTKRWVNGRASENRDEWTEKVGAYSERCYDDKEETPKVQAERILSQRRRGDLCVALQGHRVMITVDNILRAQGKMLRNKANDCLVNDIIEELSTKYVRGKARFCASPSDLAECRMKLGWATKSEHRGS